MRKDMRNKRRDKISSKKKKMIISSASLLLIVGVTVGLTLAYLADSTTALVNTFVAPTINTSVKEDFYNNTVKTSITATNEEDSDMDVYVRLKFVVQTLEFDDEDSDGEFDEGETGDIVATPTSFDEDGYLLNLPINIINVFNIEGLNIDFTGNGNGDWFTDANEETGIYFYKYSLSPGESAYDLATNVTQEVYYEGVIVRLTILVDSVQVDGVEDAWVNDVNQSENYVDANGNPILYSATYDQADDATGVPPTADRVAVEDTGTDDSSGGVGYVQRFSTNYDSTKGKNSFGSGLELLFKSDTTTE